MLGNMRTRFARVQLHIIYRHIHFFQNVRFWFTVKVKKEVFISCFCDAGENIITLPFQAGDNNIIRRHLSQTFKQFGVVYMVLNGIFQNYAAFQEDIVIKPEAQGLLRSYKTTSWAITLDWIMILT